MPILAKVMLIKVNHTHATSNRTEEEESTWAYRGSSRLQNRSSEHRGRPENSVSEDTCQAWVIFMGHVTALSIFSSFWGSTPLRPSLFFVLKAQGLVFPFLAADNYFRLSRYCMSIA